MSQLLEKLSNAFGAPGFESEVAQVAKAYIEDCAHTRTDKTGNLFIQYPNANEKKINVLLDAHQDEVGFMVRTIRPNGMLEFLPLGGWVTSNIPAQPVWIKTRSGKKIKGITASTPPHFMTQAEKNKSLDIEDLVIDVGACSKDQIRELGIEVGDPVVPAVQFENLTERQLYLGKAFDCRIGCSALLEVFKEFASEQENADFNLTGALAVQEEIGVRGAQIIANTVPADLAIVFEGAPADDTFSEEYHIQTGLGRGVMIRHLDGGMITHPGLINFALKVAEEEDIPVQRAVRKSGGTNGGIYHLAQKGIPTLVISIPVRYAHTHYGFSAHSDYENAKKLALALLRRMDKEFYERLKIN